jgi:hypothetical protein
MNLEEYSFDTTGITIVRGALSSETVERARAAIKGHGWPAGCPPLKFPVLHLDRVFWEMMTHRKVLDLSNRFAGEEFRFDHAFGLFGRNGVRGLHGGPQANQYSCFYIPLSRGTRPGLCGQLQFGFTLFGQSPKTGGFCYIPGSHKSVDPRTGGELLDQLYNGQMHHHSIVVPTLEPGDMVSFTDGLVHGDTLWKGEGEPRMQIYYRMTPGWMCWRDPAQIAKYAEYAETDLERRLLEPPWTGRYSEDDYSMGLVNERRIPTE